MSGAFAALLRDERGATMAEYGLVTALLALAAIAALTNLDNGAGATLQATSDGLQAVQTGP